MSGKKTSKKTQTEPTKTLLSPARTNYRHPPAPLDVPVIEREETPSVNDIYLSQEIQKRGHRVARLFLNKMDKAIYVKIVDSNYYFYINVDIPVRIIIDEQNTERVELENTLPIGISDQSLLIPGVDGVAMETKQGIIFITPNSEKYLETECPYNASYPMISASKYITMNSNDSIRSMYLKLRQHDIIKTSEQLSTLKKELANYNALIDSVIKTRKIAYDTLNKKGDWERIILTTNFLDEISEFTGKLKQEQVNINEKLRQISDLVSSNK